MRDDERHSAAYLRAESRDFWWNEDFLQLIARRWQLDEVTSALDVGAGLGHWSTTLLPHLSAAATITGVERDATWVREATDRARRRHLEARLEFRHGLAEQLPFPAGSFDLVTCQTLLLHTPDPAAVVREMARVTKPGGRVLLVEPVNMASSLVLGSTRFREDVDDTLRLLRFELVCYRGKERAGEGNNSIGALLPELLAGAGLGAIDAYQSDKATLLVPPYDSPEARAVTHDQLQWTDDAFWIWSKPDTQRYYLAGGGDPTTFEAEWAFALASARRVADAITQRTEHSIGAGVTFLASGVKPRSR